MHALCLSLSASVQETSVRQPQHYRKAGNTKAFAHNNVHACCVVSRTFPAKENRQLIDSVSNGQEKSSPTTTWVVLASENQELAALCRQNLLL